MGPGRCLCPIRRRVSRIHSSISLSTGSVNLQVCETSLLALLFFSFHPLIVTPVGSSMLLLTDAHLLTHVCASEKAANLTHLPTRMNCRFLLTASHLLIPFFSFHLSAGDHVFRKMRESLSSLMRLVFEFVIGMRVPCKQGHSESQGRSLITVTVLTQTPA
jgi:hypothetical protein